MPGASIDASSSHAPKLRTPVPDGTKKASSPDDGAAGADAADGDPLRPRPQALPFPCASAAAAAVSTTIATVPMAADLLLKDMLLAVALGLRRLRGCRLRVGDDDLRVALGALDDGRHVGHV